MTDIAFRPATALARLIRRKQISARELLDHYLDRIARYNPRLNAVIAMDVEAARKRARAADRDLAKGRPWGPLHGVPMTVKESYDVVGMPTTWGAPALKGNYPKQNALAVDRLNAAGVVLFGKTNVPLMLADWQSYNEVYGTTNNPWDVTRTPGGSSGGSAAALAAGLTGIEAGSDIGASIRNPAHYCGVWGHKPTWGIVPPRGQALPGRVAPGDISVIGPMGRSAEDLAVGLKAMAGPDPIAAGAWSLSLARPAKTELRQFKVAVMLEDKNAAVDHAVQERLQALADFLAKSKVKVSDRARPDFDTGEAHRVYIHLLRGATAGRQSDAEFAANQAKAAARDRGDESYYARMLRANTQSHRDWLALDNARHHLRDRWAEFFRDYDLLLCPAASGTAFPHDQAGERHDRTILVNNKRVPTTDQMFWAGYSGVAYLPSTAAPIGLARDGLPVGVQIIGPHGGDLTCIAFARLLERAFQGFLAPPGYDD